MFFGALIATYLVTEGKSLVGPYPQDMFNIPLTTISTFVLLMSSLSMVLAVSASQRKTSGHAHLAAACTDRAWASPSWAFRSFEFTHFIQAGLTLSINLFGSTFFVLTGFHGVHVAIGVIWLIVAARPHAAGR